MDTAQYAALIPLRCPLKWLLGIDCPTCGLGRSLIAAVLGRFSESFHYHPLGLPLLLLTVSSLLLWIGYPKKFNDLMSVLSEWAAKQRAVLIALLFVYIVLGFARPWYFPIPA